MASNPPVLNLIIGICNLIAGICGLIIAFSVANIDFALDIKTPENQNHIVTAQRSLRAIAISIIICIILSFMAVVLQ